MLAETPVVTVLGRGAVRDGDPLTTLPVPLAVEIPFVRIDDCIVCGGDLRDGAV